MNLPDITRIFKGARNEFEVEIVFSDEAGGSPRESHPFLELVVVVDGSITLERSDKEEVHSYTAPALVEIPAGVEHVLSSDAAMRIVIIHPHRV
jgi:quercetin dioxygenase-like cupin family protein